MKMSDPIKRWSFGGETPQMFAQHVRQSVPGYDETHDLILELSEWFLRGSSTCYDLGTSLGELVIAIAEKHPDSRCIGIDIEPAMINAAAIGKIPRNLILEAADIVDYQLSSSDMIIACYTLQFVPPRRRQDLVDKIYQALNWGGAFILFEKTRGADARFQDILNTLYLDFKKANGFNAEDILQKTRSLKGIMEPFSVEGNLGLLRRAGFKDIETVFKRLCFQGFLAIK